MIVLDFINKNHIEKATICSHFVFDEESSLITNPIEIYAKHSNIFLALRAYERQDHRVQLHIDIECEPPLVNVECNFKKTTIEEIDKTIESFYGSKASVDLFIGLFIDPALAPENGFVDNLSELTVETGHSSLRLSGASFDLANVGSIENKPITNIRWLEDPAGNGKLWTAASGKFELTIDNRYLQQCFDYSNEAISRYICETKIGDKNDNQTHDGTSDKQTA